MTRFKNIVATQQDIVPLVQKLAEWTNTWIIGVIADPPTFHDSFSKAAAKTKEHITSHLRGKVDRVVSILEREQARIDRMSNNRTQQVRSTATSDEGVIAALHSTYEGPGIIRASGPRHDNDHVDIEEIRIAPTHEELISRTKPFLPANLFGAPHPLPAESMERLLDIQFRLLREELTYVVEITPKHSLELTVGSARHLDKLCSWCVTICLREATNEPNSASSSKREEGNIAAIQMVKTP